jgi:hypothetical protein
MLIPPEHILHDLRATEGLSAIRELLQHLVDVGVFPSVPTSSFSLTFSVARK